MRTLRALAVGSAVVGLIVATPAVASARTTAPPAPRVWSTNAVVSFNLEIDGPRVLVADGIGVVGAMQPDGSIAPTVTGVPGASGIAVRGAWMAYTSTVTDEATFTNTASGLSIRTPGGATVYADTTAYEQAHNPDQVNTYGVTAGGNECTDEVLGGSYTGQLDSHAYSVASDGGRGWIVADAGANDLLRVDDSGGISTLAVLPAQPVVITAEAAAALGMPGCVVGATYSFEPVPTDVEVAGGSIYVTTLPGGPEDASLGARGTLWRVDGKTGAVTQVATGFAGPTNLAVGKQGEIYVAELFGGRISVVRGGAVSTYAELPGVVAVETAPNGTVWAATMAGDDPAVPGMIVSISDGKVHVQGRVH